MTRKLATLESIEHDARLAFEDYKEQIESGELEVEDAATDAISDGVIYTADQINLAKDHHFASEDRAKIANGCEELISLAHEGNPDWADYTGRVANAIARAIYENTFRKLAAEQ